jgi:dynein heavy chain 1
MIYVEYCYCNNLLQVDDLLAIEEHIDVEVRSLESCAYNPATFTDILNKIQKAVDDLSLHQYSNLPQWTAKLDQEVTSYYYL